jgi:hypothetical protein
MSIETFNYLNDKNYQEMFLNAYQAIELTEMWNFMKQDIDSYMWTRSNEVSIISNKMSELGYDCHSGNSFGWIMRHMQFIATHGLEAHKKTWVNDQ